MVQAADVLKWEPDTGLVPARECSPEHPLMEPLVVRGICGNELHIKYALTVHCQTGH